MSTTRSKLIPQRSALIGYGVASVALALVIVAGNLRNVPSPAPTEIWEPISEAQPASKKNTKKTPTPKKSPKTAPQLGGAVPASRELVPVPGFLWFKRSCDSTGYCWTYF